MNFSGLIIKRVELIFSFIKKVDKFRKKNAHLQYRQRIYENKIFSREKLLELPLFERLGPPINLVVLLVLVTRTVNLSRSVS